jgi:hypothetical protein
MAIKLENLQTTACDILKGMNWFAGKPDLLRHIYADDGLQNDAMEDSLKSIGWCLAVSMPLSTSTRTQTSAGASSPDNHGSSSHDVLIVVSIRTNPKKNKGQEAMNVLVMTRCVVKAFLSWRPANGDRGFFLPPERALEPDFEDIGNVSYDVRVLKNVPL